MFGKLVRTLMGGGEQTPQPATRESSVSASDILSVPNPALRALFESRLRGLENYPDVVRQQIRTACTDAFVGDPLPLALELLTRAPIMKMLARQPDDAIRRLSAAFNEALNSARVAVTGHHGNVFSIPDARLPLVLHALGTLVAQGERDLHWGQGQWLLPIVRSTAASQNPGARQMLVRMFSSFFAAGPSVHEPTRILVEKLLPEAGLERSDIPELVAYDDRCAQLDAMRAAILADAGAPLDAAISAILDRQVGDFASLRDAEKNPAFRAIADLSPEDRGHALQKLMVILESGNRYGFEQWGALIRDNGAYRVSAKYSQSITAFGTLLATMTTRKIVLPDPDRDMARFLALMPPHYPRMDHKKIVDLVLSVVRDNPRGETAKALKQLVAPGGNAYAFKAWVTDIEDVLRLIPPVAHAALAAPAPARPVAGGLGFGRKGLAPSIPQSVIPGLPAIELPDFQIDKWDCDVLIGNHFDNPFEARLYDAAHRSVLERLENVHRAVLAGATEPGRERNLAIVRVAKEAGFPLAGDHDAGRAARCITIAALAGSDLHHRFAAFAPFVTASPEVARAFGKHAKAIAGKSAPTDKWLAETRDALSGLTADQKAGMFDALFASPAPSLQLAAGEVYARALLYAAVDLDPAIIGPKLTAYALKNCYVTQPNFGIRSEKLGNACLWTLAALPDGAGVPYLARILARTKYPKIKAKIDAKLNEAAAAAGMSRGTLDELTVPTHGLDRTGVLRAPLGDGESVLRIDGARSVTIDWIAANGKPLKAPSVAMKADKDALKEVRATAKELEADLSTQAARLQRLFLENRRWAAADWQARYLDHPVMQSLTRRLLWWVERDGADAVAALPDLAGEGLCDSTGAPLALDGATIRLWHPIDADAAAVEAWRDRLEALDVTQPFAQAWREVYALTDAERTTGTYSNRWAAHILRQHQAMTLARINGWRVTHRMWVDAANDAPWHLTIPAHGLVADYWVEGAGGDNPDVSESGAYSYVTTDRVQFHSIDPKATDSAHGPARGDAVLLTQIPPIVFSEIMRQADLFSSVASIAADPNWLDRGGAAEHPTQWGAQAHAYWTRTNTAALEESGKRRRAILERIVPKLAIAPQVQFDERFLIVKGTRHSYRIHLGSGACFRGERHICIVPKPETARERIWLPFEGDQTLSIIISKAVLLAADAKITDPVILAQL